MLFIVNYIVVPMDNPNAKVGFDNMRGYVMMTVKNIGETSEGSCILYHLAIEHCACYKVSWLSANWQQISNHPAYRNGSYIQELSSEYP